MKTNFEILFDKTSKKVENYQSDFEHDKRTLEKYSKDRFIHIARKHGTCLYVLEKDISHYPKKGESVAYLFGTAKREHILKEGAASISYYAKEEGHLYHYYDGSKLVKVDSNRAVEIANDYVSGN
jgi:hypothetical protein